jgi:hypothetical protein
MSNLVQTHEFLTNAMTRTALSESSAGLQTREDGARRRDERRDCLRLPCQVAVRLKTLGHALSDWSVSRDVSASGLAVKVAAQSGLAVGQRCELEVLEDDPRLHLTGEQFFATVVRTAPVSDDEEHIQAGLRFDREIYLATSPVS